jgi:membrane protease YdiL (CAAX protease family)
MLQMHWTGGLMATKFFAVSGAAIGFMSATLVLLRKPWGFEFVERQLIKLLVCSQLGLLLWAWAMKLAGSPAPSTAQMVIGGLCFQGATLPLARRFLRDHGVSLAEAFGLSHKRLTACLSGLVVAALFLPIGLSLQIGSAHLIEWAGPKWPALHLKPEVQQAVQTLESADTFRTRVMLAALTILLAPLAEEVLFRGILYPWIKSRGFPRLALWGTATMFATMHMNLISFVPLLLLAVALTLLYERTCNLLAPISGHALFNAINFALLFYYQNAGHTAR